MSKFLFILCLLFTGTLAASPDLCHPLTLAELVDIALENHPSTKQAWWNANRAAAALGSAKSDFYPSVDVEASATHGRDFKFINGPDVNYNIVGADLILSMMLYDFGERRANVNASKMALQAANWQSDWNIQLIMLKVLENAYSTLHAQEVFQAACISLQEAEKVLNATRELNRAGLRPISDVYISQTTLSQMKMELSQQKAMLAIQKGSLASSLGLSATTTLELAPIDALQLPENPQIEELITLAMQQRADLMAKQAKLSETAYIKDKIRSSYQPKLFFSGRGGFNRAFHKHENGAQYQVTLNLAIPLFDGFETLYNNRLAYADAKLSMAELAELQLEISLEVLTYSHLLQAAQNMLPDAQEYLKNANQAYESVLEKYKAGKVSIVEVSDAQRELAAARVKYSDINTQWLQSIANLAYSTGTLAPYMETPCENQ